MRFIFKILYIVCIVALFDSCSLLDIDPKHVVSSEEAFSDVESYQMSLNNVYRNLTGSLMTMQSTDYAGDDFINVIPGYSSTNFSVYNWDYKSQPQPFVWANQYQIVANCNVLVDNYDFVPVKTELDGKLRDQIYAQALAVRAWCFFNIVQLYAPRYDGTNGDAKGIPLKLSLELGFLPRAPLKDVYDQIFDDLTLAEELFVESAYKANSYKFGMEAVDALRARVALFIGDYEMARQSSKDFIDIELLDKDDYDMLWSDEFGSDNNEIIFMVDDLSDTDDGDLIDYYDIYAGNNAVLSGELKNLFSSNDIRSSIQYINTSGYSSKYIIDAIETGGNASRMLNYKYFRVAEQYLIYAESILGSDPQKAKEVINKLRSKRGAELLTSVPDKEIILNERRRELFSEGLRFYDLKRLAKELNITVERASGRVLTPSSDLYVWDIPTSEINSNPNI